jgi:oligoendopeptidase F
MRDLADLQDLLGRAASYVMLSFSENTADPTRGALLQRMQEKATAIETRLLFFELEWAALDDERAERLLGADGLDFARHHLRTARRYRPHLLSEPEEKILAEKALTGRSAWTRLFEERPPRSRSSSTRAPPRCRSRSRSRASSTATTRSAATPRRA